MVERGPSRRGRNVFGDPTGAWQLPVFTEWELTSSDFTDEHPHDEFNYVLDGELHVEVDGETVVARVGDLVRVPAGSRGRYFAPIHARMLAVYGPNPDGKGSVVLGGSRLADPPEQRP